VRITQIRCHQICDFSDQITGVRRLSRLLRVCGLGGVALSLNLARSRGLDAGRARLKGSLVRAGRLGRMEGNSFITAYARILLLDWSCAPSFLGRRSTAAWLLLGALRLDADAQRMFKYQLSD
jgi:hypothetical protein